MNAAGGPASSAIWRIAIPIVSAAKMPTAVTTSDSGSPPDARTLGSPHDRSTTFTVPFVPRIAPTSVQNTREPASASATGLSSWAASTSALAPPSRQGDADGPDGGAVVEPPHADAKTSAQDNTETNEVSCS